MAKINFGGVEENVVTREEFPLEKALETLKDETIAVIGYGGKAPDSRSTCATTDSGSSWASAKAPRAGTRP